MENTWTITELAAEAAAALAEDRPAVNGRVRDLPNERLIRWYTTIGLVDPPLARRGRTALYGRRHLLQLLAVKRRQAAGRSIAEIQVELAGATDDMLRSVARLPTPPAAPLPAEVDVGRRVQVTEAWPPQTPPDRFWTRAPDSATALPLVPVPGTRSSSDPVDAAGPAVSASVVQGVQLAPGVTLLVDGTEAMGADELAAIESAARPLLDELIRLGRRVLPGRST